MLGMACLDEWPAAARKIWCASESSSCFGWSSTLCTISVTCAGADQEGGIPGSGGIGVGSGIAGRAAMMRT
jgi:hypothetical protein